MQINKRVLQETISIEALQNETIDVQIPEYARNIVGVLINASSNNVNKHNYVSKLSWVKGRILSIDDLIDMFLAETDTNAYTTDFPSMNDTLIDGTQCFRFYQFILSYLYDNSNDLGKNYIEREYYPVDSFSMVKFLKGKRFASIISNVGYYSSQILRHQYSVKHINGGIDLESCKLKTRNFLKWYFRNSLDVFCNDYPIKSHILKRMRWDSFCCGTASASFEGSNKLILRDVPVDLNNIRKSIVFDVINVEQTEEPNSFVRFVFKNNRRFNTEIKLNIYLFYI